MKTFNTTLIATALLAMAGSAQAEISANVAIATDYMFRGVSQTDNSMALSGGFDWAHDSGFYVGTWMSNVNSSFFNGDGVDPQMEMDFYAGFAGEMNDFGYDISLVQFEYTGCDSCDTTELYLKGNYGMFNATFAYSNELGYIGSTESAWYFNVGVEAEVTEGFTAHAAIGYSGGDAYDTTLYPDGYTDYNVGISTSLQGVDLDLSYIDTSKEAETNFGDGITDGRVLFSVSKSF